MLNVKLVCDALGVTKRTVINWINRPNGLKATKIGSQWRIAEDDLYEFIKSSNKYITDNIKKLCRKE